MEDQRNITQFNLSRSWIRWTTGHGHSGPRKQSISIVHYWVRHAKCTRSSWDLLGIWSHKGWSSNPDLRSRMARRSFLLFFLHNLWCVSFLQFFTFCAATTCKNLNGGPKYNLSEGDEKAEDQPKVGVGDVQCTPLDASFARFFGIFR